MNAWIIVWLMFWIGGIGVPLYLFKKHKITIHGNPWQHILFYIFLIVLLFIVYKDYFQSYFDNISAYLFWSIPFIIFSLIFILAKYEADYYTEKERFNYQLPKFFEIIFQQLCFLGGLLTFGVSPIVFGLIFFTVHTPFISFVPKSFALFVTTASLVGGMTFAYLQSRGVVGFFISSSLHLLFWFAFHYILSKKLFGIVPVKR